MRAKDLEDVKPALVSLQTIMMKQIGGECRLDVMNMDLDGLHALAAILACG